MAIDKLTITRQQARRFLLEYQGLGQSFELQGKQGILDYIRRVGYIQFDSLNIAGRNPELVLQARIPDFKPVMLHDLLYKERLLLDGPDKEMCIYSVSDWPYFRRQREAALQRFGNNRRPIVPFLPQVRQEITKRGPLSSLDLEFDQIVDWPWAPTRLSRAALESMYLWGELIIHHKVNTRKVYDFAHHHLPAELLATPEPNKPEEEYREWLVLRRIGAVGMLWSRSGDAWRGIQSKDRQATLTRLLKQKTLQEIEIEGIKFPFYIRTANKSRLDSKSAIKNQKPHAAILAPLDNLLWDRNMVKALFDFEYRWEVYKPAAERKYGYYVLPVLYGDRFIARFEPGKDPVSKGLIIKNWWWEPKVNPSAALKRALQSCFQGFLHYLGTDTLVISNIIRNNARLGFLEIDKQTGNIEE
jgi:uncharacterized protein YcaQ